MAKKISTSSHLGTRSVVAEEDAEKVVVVSLGLKGKSMDVDSFC